MEISQVASDEWWAKQVKLDGQEGQGEKISYQTSERIPGITIQSVRYPVVLPSDKTTHRQKGRAIRAASGGVLAEWRLKDYAPQDFENTVDTFIREQAKMEKLLRGEPIHAKS